MTKSMMEALGFIELNAASAAARWQCPTSSPNGDNIWIHEETGVWSQGIPVSGSQLFRAIYNAGVESGKQTTITGIRKALGL